LPVSSHQSTKLLVLWASRWIKWPLYAAWSRICMNLTHRHASVLLLLFTVIHCTQQDSSCDVISHYKSPPPPCISDMYRSAISRKVAFNTYRLSLTDNIKSDIDVVLHCNACHLYKQHVSLVASCEHCVREDNSIRTEERATAISFHVSLRVIFCKW
jgi:hypothetical protein